MTEKIVEQRLLAGKINAAYGIKGWIKVFSYTDPLDQILDYDPWYLRQGTTGFKPVRLDQARKHGKGIIVLPEGFEDRNQAEGLVGSEVWVDRHQLPDLQQGEFFWHQLEGLAVYNEAGELLGNVSHLLETGANDVLVVKPGATSIDDRERLIPYVEKDIVLSVDLDEGKVLVAWEADF